MTRRVQNEPVQKAWRAWRVALGMLVLLATGLAQAAPASVLVKSREQGQGLLVRRADSCLLLTAHHVINGVDRASVVGSVGARRFGEARLLMRFIAQDLALLRVQGEIARDCGDDLESYRGDLSRVLSRRPQGSLPFVFDSAAGGGAGGLSRLPVVVTDLGPEWLRVLPQRSGEAIEQGRSGSVVLVSDGGVDRAAGLLLAVEAEGEGKVLRLDQAVALIERYFANPAAFASPVAASAAQHAVTEPPGNLLAQSAGARVARWSAAPSGPEYLPSNLLDPQGTRSWNAASRPGPVDVDLQLARGEVQTIGRIELVTAQDQPLQRSAKEVEVFSSVDGRSWRSVHTGTVFREEAVKVIELAPLRAAWLRLRIHQNWGDPDWVSLRQVRAYRP